MTEKLLISLQTLNSSPQASVNYVLYILAAVKKTETDREDALPGVTASGLTAAITRAFCESLRQGSLSRSAHRPKNWERVRYTSTIGQLRAFAATPRRISQADSLKNTYSANASTCEAFDKQGFHQILASSRRWCHLTLVSCLTQITQASDKDGGR